MFADRIKYLRQSRELTQVQLADKLGVTKQSVSTGWVNSCLKRVGTARQSKHQENTALPSLTQGLFPPQEKLA